MNEKRNTPLMELRNQIEKRIEHDSKNKDVKFIQGQINGFKMALDMIDQLLPTEKEVIKEVFMDSRENISECEVWNCEGAEKKHSNFNAYFNEIFKQIEQ